MGLVAAISGKGVLQALDISVGLGVDLDRTQPELEAGCQVAEGGPQAVDYAL